MSGSPRRERKVVTVLFADLVGFTARAEELDPEDVEAILRPYHERLRKELERYGGTVEKFIGDAVMSVFGAPVAHEDDAERAVRAALAIRDSIREDAQLEVRIALNTGEALVNLDARPDVGEGMVAGDVVNTAARLQSAAPTNGILVGERTYRATRDVVEYRAHEPVEAKGKSAAVPVWEAVQTLSRIDVDVRPRTPLVGRAREIDVLVDAFARVRGERSPQLVTLVGEPGIGKSRLVYELFRAIEDDPELIWWRQGRSLPYGEGISFWALGEIVKAQAGILETDAPETAEEKLRATVAQMTDMEWLVRHFLPLIGLAGEDLGTERGEAFAAWRRFFENLAEQRPLVLVFEDLQWADEGLLDFVDHLVDWASGVPILVVASARPELLERRPGWGGGKRNATTLSLSPLAEDDTARLLVALLDRSVLPAETQQELLARAGGNPLYAEEFARMLTEQATGEVPATVQGVIAARLDGLAQEEKALLQQAAVVGRVFWLGALGREHEARLHALERKEFVRRERRSSVEGDTEYAFLHVLVRDVAYGQIARADRADLHERAARWIESLGRSEDVAEMLAHHFLQALEYARASGRETSGLEVAAANAFARAGDRSFALNAYDAAVRYYEQALAQRATPDGERRRLLLQHAHAAFFVDPLSIDVLERTHGELAELGDVAGSAEVAALMSWSAWTQGNRERAVRTLREAVAKLGQVPASRAKATVLHELARVTTMAGEADGIDAARAALEAAREAGARDLEARSLNTFGMARVNISGDAAGVDDTRRSLSLALEIPSPMDICRAYVNLASSTFATGELEQSWQYHFAGVEAAERWGLTAPIRWFQGERSEYDYHAGRWDEALRSCDEFIAGTEQSPHYLESPIRGQRSLLRIARGDVEGALADDVRQTELARAIGDPQVLQQSLATSVFVRLQAGQLDEAHRRFTELVALWRDTSRPYFNPAEPAFAAVALQRTQEFLAAPPGALASRWLDAACAFVGGEYLRSAELYREIGSLPNEAYARVASGDQAEVQHALVFYRSVGALHYIRNAETMLGATA